MNRRINWMFIIMTVKGTNMNNSEIRLVLNESVKKMNHEAVTGCAVK